MHATSWINLENMLSEISQKQRTNTVYSTYMKYLEQVNSQKQKEQRLPGAGAEENANGMLMVTEFLFWVMKESFGNRLW